jgi:hypothetical protein
VGTRREGRYPECGKLWSLNYGAKLLNLKQPLQSILGEGMPSWLILDHPVILLVLLDFFIVLKIH